MRVPLLTAVAEFWRRDAAEALSRSKTARIGPRPFLVVATAFGVMVVSGCAGSSSSGVGASSASSAAANDASSYCDYFLSRGKELHDEFTGASNASSGDPLGSLLTLLGAPGQLASFFDGLSARSPDEIKGDVDALAAAFHQEVSNAGQAATDPIGGIVQGLEPEPHRQRRLAESTRTRRNIVLPSLPPPQAIERNPQRSHRARQRV